MTLKKTVKLLPPNTPNVALEPHEYLAILVQSSPRESLAWYLRRLHKYKGVPFFMARASNTIPKSPWALLMHTNRQFFIVEDTPRKTVFLTHEGFEFANRSRQKIGLNPIKPVSNPVQLY